MAGLQQGLAQLDRDLRQMRADYRRRLELNQALDRSRPNADVPLGRLSRQERRVAEMLASGLTNRELAGDLHLTVHTVKSHVSSILRKLELRSRWELARVLQGPSAADPRRADTSPPARRSHRSTRGPKPSQGHNQSDANHEDGEPPVERMSGNQR